MEQRIRNFIALKDKLSVVSQDCLDGCDRFEEKKRLEARLNGAIKTLSAEKFAKIVGEDLRFCIDFKTANPLLWICGIDLKELPMSTPLVGSSLGLEYSPGVWIYIGPGDHHFGELQNLRFSVDDMNENHSCYSNFNLNNMRQSFCDTLETAESYREAYLGENEGPTDEDHDKL